MNQLSLNDFMELHMKQGGTFVPARLQSMLALLERLRDHPELMIERHLAKAGQSLAGHETYGDAAHQRLGLEPINKNHGRRSSNLGAWGQQLLDLLAEHGFKRLTADARGVLIDGLQNQVAAPLHQRLSEEPLSVRTKGRSAASVITDLLDQAEAKGQLGAVAQYLVGAKLQLRFPDRASEILILGSNRGDRRSRGDEDARRGDFDLGEYVFEITVASPDAKHSAQVEQILADVHAEAWLLVRDRHLQAWNKVLSEFAIDHHRLVVASIELFVGQNVAELGQLSADGQREQLLALFEIYNSQWIPKVGSPAIIIQVK